MSGRRAQEYSHCGNELVSLRVKILVNILVMVKDVKRLYGAAYHDGLISATELTKLSSCGALGQ